MVQGVGFRYTARYLAGRYGIRGWVMNLPDRRVELLAQGEEKKLKDFLKDIQDEFQNYITNIKTEEVSLDPGLEGFQIKFYSY
jgi:acylphosphatase